MKRVVARYAFSLCATKYTYCMCLKKNFEHDKIQITHRQHMKPEHTNATHTPDRNPPLFIFLYIYEVVSHALCSLDVEGTIKIRNIIQCIVYKICVDSDGYLMCIYVQFTLTDQLNMFICSKRRTSRALISLACEPFSPHKHY